MYRKGLSRRQIADLVGAAPATVGYHIGIARKLFPGLHEEHQAAAGAKLTKVTMPGLERMHQLVALVQETGRYPSRHTGSESERTLAAWLQRRRKDARAGTLAPAFREGLSVLPGWQTPPRVEGDENRWQERLKALAEYRAAGNDWPRHKAGDPGEEHELGVWLHSQRYKLRRGELDGEKINILDSSVPGWRVGRKRGRQAGGSY